VRCSWDDTSLFHPLLSFVVLFFWRWDWGGGGGWGGGVWGGGWGGGGGVGERSAHEMAGRPAGRLEVSQDYPRLEESAPRWREVGAGSEANGSRPNAWDGGRIPFRQRGLGAGRLWSPAIEAEASGVSRGDLPRSCDFTSFANRGSGAEAAGSGGRRNSRPTGGAGGVGELT